MKVRELQEILSGFDPDKDITIQSIGGFRDCGTAILKVRYGIDWAAHEIIIIPSETLSIVRPK